MDKGQWLMVCVSLAIVAYGGGVRCLPQGGTVNVSSYFPQPIGK